MRIALGAITDLLFSDVTSPHTSISVEETLICCQTVFLAKRTEFGGILISSISYLQTTVIRQVLTQCQTTIGIQVGQHLDLAEEVCKRKGWELKKQPIDWDAKDMELSSGAIDCIWNGFTIQGRED